MKKIFYFLFVLIIILITACTVKTSCEDLEDQFSKDDCYFNKATGAVVLNTCSNIQSDVVKNSCIAEIGIKNAIKI
jgi:hypothetical protein